MWVWGRQWRKKGEQEDSGEDGKKGTVMQDHPVVLANWEDFLKQFLENKESLWAFRHGTSQHQGNPILGLHRELSWSLLHNLAWKTVFYSWRSSYNFFSWSIQTFCLLFTLKNWQATEAFSEVVPFGLNPSTTKVQQKTLISQLQNLNKSHKSALTPVLLPLQPGRERSSYLSLHSQI